jgi:hypothetical protein
MFGVQTEISDEARRSVERTFARILHEKYGGTWTPAMPDTPERGDDETAPGDEPAVSPTP